MRYLILSLPRSRSTWLAAFLDCDHDVGGEIEHIDELDKYDGVCDTGLGLFATKVVEKYPIPIVVIERDVKECERSLSRIGFSADGLCEAMLNQMKRIKDNPLVKWVKFEELDSEIESICNHIGVEYHLSRHMRYSAMMIEPTKKHMIDTAESNKHKFPLLVKSLT